MNYNILQGDCFKYFEKNLIDKKVDLSFLDPPFNQNKEYNYHNDSLPNTQYWEMMKTVCQNVYSRTRNGGAIYFMQREKNTESVLKCLRETEWTLQNLIIWKKKTSAVPCSKKYGKNFQVIINNQDINNF